MASDSDCFSKATVSTRSWTPAATSWLAHDGGRAAHRAGGVHPEQRLADRAERVGQEQLRHHHALEEVGGLADDDGVDVRPGHLGVGERPVGGLAHEAGHRHVAPGGRVLGLADADDGDSVVPISSPFQDTATRFCCRHGPLVAWATPRSASPAMIRLAASPMRMRPAAIIGLAASAPPDGLTRDVVAEAERLAEDQLLVGERGVQLGDVDHRSATPAFSAADASPTATGEVAEAERRSGSMRWSMPRIQAGRSQCSRATSPAARITAAAPSVIGAQSLLRSGSTIGSSARIVLHRAVPLELGVGVVEGVARLRRRPRPSAPR